MDRLFYCWNSAGMEGIVLIKLTNFDPNKSRTQCQFQLEATTKGLWPTKTYTSFFLSKKEWMFRFETFIYVLYFCQNFVIFVYFLFRMNMYLFLDESLNVLMIFNLNDRISPRLAVTDLQWPEVRWPRVWLRRSQVTLERGAWTPGWAPRQPRGPGGRGNPGDRGERGGQGTRGNTVPPDQQDWPYATQCWDKHKKVQLNVLTKEKVESSSLSCCVKCFSHNISLVLCCESENDFLQNRLWCCYPEHDWVHQQKILSYFKKSFVHEISRELWQELPPVKLIYACNKTCQEEISYLKECPGTMLRMPVSPAKQNIVHTDIISNSQGGIESVRKFRSD